ncbi:hypothetical protein B0J14DRAFT_672491 [Halenospora varia]|nr:hypothetical protein B0J14DRAFT_672491 [Halenospora varia]
MLTTVTKNKVWARQSLALRQKKTKPQYSTFHNLPEEIFIVLQNHLTGVTEACLSMTCKKMRRILMQANAHLARDQAPWIKDTKIDFYTLLSIDRNEIFSCYFHGFSHHVEDVAWPRRCPPKERLYCTLADAFFRHLSGSFFVLGFAHVQLALKEARCGMGHGIPLEGFNHLEANEDEKDGTSTLCSVDARVINNEFYTRSQTLLRLPTTNESALIPILFRRIEICSHYSGATKSRLVEFILTHIILGPDKMRFVAIDSPPLDIFSCRECHVDFNVEVVDCEEKGFVVCTTRWMNFGSCHSTTDPKWLSHLLSDCWYGHIGFIHVKHEPRSIYALYEGQEGRSLETLARINLRYLFIIRERRCTEKWENLPWKWTPDQPDWWYRRDCGPSLEKGDKKGEWKIKKVRAVGEFPEYC